MARDFDDDMRDFGGDSVRAALSAAHYPLPDFAPTDDAPADKRSFTAKPFVWRDPATIPRRQFLYGFELRRRQLSAVIAPGAAGKTTFKIGRAICMATGKNLMGHNVWNGPHRVWLWNLEDDLEEIEKTVHAFLKAWNLDHNDLGDRLYINGADSIGADGLKLAVESDFGGFKIQRPVSGALIEELTRLKIDYLDVDPFVSSHSVDENKNQAIDAVAKEWLRIAHEANCAVGLAHHLRKATGAEFTANDARGAGAMINAARSVLVLQKMTPETAEQFRVPDCDRKKYFSVYDDKNNKAAAALQPDWYEFVSVGLGNAGVGSDGPEDNIGAIKRWTAPDAFGGVGVRQLYQVQCLVEKNPDKARKHSKSKDWVGKQIAYVLDRNLDDPGDARAIEKMIRTWLASGALRTVERQAGDRHVYEYVEVGTWAKID